MPQKCCNERLQSWLSKIINNKLIYGIGAEQMEFENEKNILFNVNNANNISKLLYLTYMGLTMIICVFLESRNFINSMDTLIYIIHVF